MEGENETSLAGEVRVFALGIERGKVNRSIYLVW